MQREHPPPMTEIILPRTLGCSGLGQSQGVTAVVCHMSSSTRTIPSVMLNIQLLAAWLHVTTPPASPGGPCAKSITTTSQRVSDFRESACFSLELHQKISPHLQLSSRETVKTMHSYFVYSILFVYIFVYSIFLKHIHALCILDYSHVGDKGTAAQSNCVTVPRHTPSKSYQLIMSLSASLWLFDCPLAGF